MSEQDLVYLASELITRSGTFDGGVNVLKNKEGHPAIGQEPYGKANNIKSGEREGKSMLPSTKSVPDAETNVVTEAAGGVAA